MYKVDFLENLKQNLVDATADELVDFVVYVAKLLPSELYHDALAWFQQDISVDKEAKTETADLFAEIERLSSEIEEGGYEFHWDFDNYGYYDYGDDADGDELVDVNGLGREITKLIPQIMKVAQNEQYEEAYQLFSQLFSLSVSNDYGDDIDIEQLFDRNLIRLDYHEVLNIYAYVVLVSKRGKERAKILYEIIDNSNFKIEAVLKSGTTSIGDETEFYQEWIEYLCDLEIDKYWVKNRDNLLIDALTSSGGINALRSFVAEHGMKHANVVFKLLQADIQNENFFQAVETIKKGFNEINGIDDNKTKLADYLIAIARKSNDELLLKEGIIEGFKSSLQLEYYGEIHAWQDVDLIREMLDYLEVHVGKSDFHYFCIHFLNGNHELIWNECVKDTMSLGWSHSLKGFIFPLLLVAITKDELGILTTDMVNYRGNQLRYVQFAELLTNSKLVLTDSQNQEYSKWCENQIGLRVDAIVTNQHRGAYDRAAKLIVAMGEILMTNYNEQTGMNYILKFKQTYPRHNSFQKSLRENLALIGRKF